MDFISGHSQMNGFGRIGKNHTEETKKKISATKRSISIDDWVGFAGEEDYRLRRLFRNVLQGKVFIRDNYTCQMCGDYGCDLQVHHLKSWVDYPDFRFDTSNCQTLCVKCHYLITYGKPMPTETTAWGHNLMKGRIAK